MTLTADYQIEFNTIVMGSGTAYDIVAVVGAGFPAVRDSDIDRQDDHGSFVSRRELLQERTLNIEIDIIGADPGDLWSKVNILKRAFVPSDTIRVLSIRMGATGWGATYGEDVSFYGFSRQFTMNLGDSANYNTTKAYIQFVCPDPRAYALAESNATITTGTAGLGWRFPWTFLWTFGLVAPAIGNVVNTGYFDTPPRFRFNGPTQNPRVSNVNTGEFMEFDLDIITGDYLEVDMRAKTVLLNGTGNRYSYRKFGSSWFPLRPGSNAIQYSNTYGAGTPGTLQVFWRSASL